MISDQKGWLAMDFSKIKSKYKTLPVQVRASFWFLICSFLQKGISMLTTPIFTRLLSTSEYGQYNVFNSWLGITIIIVSLCLYAGVHAQGLIKYDNEQAIFSSALQGLTTVLVLAWTLIYLLFQSFWNNLLGLTTIQILAMLLMTWMTAIFGFWANEQRVSYSYKTLVIVTVLVSIAKPFLGIFLVLHSTDKVTARILGLLIVECIGYSWMYVYQMKRGKVFFSKKFWLYALAFNIPLVPHYLSQTVLNSADRIIIQRMVGESEAGIYSLAYSLSQIMVLFNTALSQTISPWMYQKIKGNKSKEIAPIAYMTLIIVAIVNLTLILLAPEAVRIFAPPSYYDAIWIIPPVAMSVYFMFSYDLFSKYAFYHEKTKFIMTASVAGAILNIVLNYFCIKQFGYVAAGYTTLLCYLVYSTVHYYFMKRVCDQFCGGQYPYDTKVILAITLPFMALGFIFLCTYQTLPAVRYSILILFIILLIVRRKYIIEVIKNLISLRNSK